MTPQVESAWSQLVESASLSSHWFQIDSNPRLYNAGVGKANFEHQHLVENVGALMATILDVRPKGVKGAPSASNYVKGATISTTMAKGSVKLALPSLFEAAGKKS